jgi:hypothetical protein
VPAAAVIPAPRVYIKVVAVKKLVVGLWVGVRSPRGRQSPGRRLRTSFLFCKTSNAGNGGFTGFTLNKLGCSKQANRLEYISMG